MSGLNNISVDYRPTVELIMTKKDESNGLLPEGDVAPQNVPQPPKAEAKSVVQQLDVLLLNAAGKSVSADIVKNVNTIGTSLIAKGVLTQKQLSKLESRLGLSELSLGGTAYVSKQTTANLNLATQDTAETFGCKDLVVKYSVGSHNGQFGVFMEKAKGCEGSGFACMNGTGGDDGIMPLNLGDEIKDDAERRKIKGTVAQKLNKLMWLDLITGQGDRHWNNYFVHIHKDSARD